MAIKPNTNTNYPYLNQRVDYDAPIVLSDIDRVPWWQRKMSIELCFEKANRDINQLEIGRQEILKNAAYFLKQRLIKAYATYIECKSIWTITDYPNWTIEKCDEKYNKDIEDAWKKYEEAVQSINSAHNRLLLEIEAHLKICLENATNDIPTDTR